MLPVTLWSRCCLSVSARPVAAGQARRPVRVSAGSRRCDVRWFLLTFPAAWPTVPAMTAWPAADCPAGSPTAATTTPSSGRARPGPRTSALMREAGVDRGHRRGLLLGAARAGAGPVRARLARRRARPAARARHRRRPGHRHRVAAALAHRGAPRDAAVHRRRHRALARRPAGVVPQLAGLPRARAGPGDARSPSGTPTTRPWRCGTCPTSSAATTRTATATCQPPAFRDWLRARYGDARRAQRRLGHRVLEPALRRLGRDPPAAHRADLRQPHPAAGLPAVQLRRAAGLLRRRARPAAPAQPGVPVTTNFMVDASTSATWTTCAWAPSWTSSPTTTT